MMVLNESAPQWVKDIWPDAKIVPDGELMGIKPASEAAPAPTPAASKPADPTPRHWESGGINPHARPDGGEYGRD